jgi:hypothetical protein
MAIPTSSQYMFPVRIQLIHALSFLGTGKIELVNLTFFDTFSGIAIRVHEANHSIIE